MISRRQALIAGAVAAAGLPEAAAAAHPDPATPPAPKLPDRYDEPLGIGLEGWPYPAPVRWQPCTIGGQTLRMAYMDIPPTAKQNYRTVVLLHGKNFDSSYWAGPIKFLTEAGYRVIVPDQIGFNKSSKPDIAYSFDVLADLTINLLAGLQIGQASLIGHSIGGMLAVRIASAYPVRVEKLILEDPIGLVDYRSFVPPQSTETLIAAERRRTLGAYRGFMKDYFPILPAKEVERFVEWRMRLALSGEYERYCKAAALAYQMIYREPVRSEYGDIRAPTLMIIGEKDQAAPLKQYASPEMAAKMPSIPMAAPGAVKDLQKGSLVTVPGVGHVPHLEAPDVFRDKVLEFLKT